MTTGWLVGVARHKLADHWRRRAHEDRGLRAVAVVAGGMADDPWDERLEALRARAVLEELGPHHRAALTLRYLDDLPVPEVASCLSRSLHATESLLVPAHRRADLAADGSSRRCIAIGSGGDRELYGAIRRAAKAVDGVLLAWADGQDVTCPFVNLAIDQAEPLRPLARHNRRSDALSLDAALQGTRRPGLPDDRRVRGAVDGQVTDDERGTTASGTAVARASAPTRGKQVPVASVRSTCSRGCQHRSGPPSWLERLTTCPTAS